MKNISLLSLLIITSCSNNIDKIENQENTPKISVTNPNINGCYEMIISKDSALMNINTDKELVSGTLEYKRFEKDSNKGSFTGTINDSIIDAWYNFQSEGIISVRQIRFKIEGQNILEGYGDIEQKGDTVFFKYPQTLKYEKDHPFIKIKCN